MFDEYWIVWEYNDLDSGFGCKIGPTPYVTGLEKAEAKSIARALNKRSPEFIWYFAEPEPRRWV